MGRKGRPPLAAGHVEHLRGSELAKLRLTMILEAAQGMITVGEACARLGICESRFHALRNHWLQEALELLEPRRMGRPPQETAPADVRRRLEALEAENRELREQLTVADVRRELAEVLPDLGRAARRPPQKSTPARAGQKSKRRR